MAVVAGPWADRLLEAALPLQRTVYAWLMPKFEVYEFGFVRSAGHLKLQVLAISHRYLWLQGQVFPPGVGLRAETPARVALTYAALVLAGAVLLVRGRGWRSWGPAVLAGMFATVMLCGVTPLILAGQQWGTVVEPFSEVSAAAWLGGVSDVLLHGGGYGLAGLAVVLVRAASKRQPAARAAVRPEA